jgi:hypothetical protein
VHGDHPAAREHRGLMRFGSVLLLALAGSEAVRPPARAVTTAPAPLAG